MESIIVFKENLDRLLNSSDSYEYTTNLLQYEISSDYFDKIQSAIRLIVDFENKYLGDKKVQTCLSNTIENFEQEDTKLFILADVMRCYEGLDHPTSLSTPEGIAILLLIGQIYGVSEIHFFEDLENVSSKEASLIDLTPYIRQCSYDLPNRQSLFLSSILEKIDEKVDSLYRLLIYNICKRIAEVDGVISFSEKEWLEEIARLDDDDPTNDIDISVLD